MQLKVTDLDYTIEGTQVLDAVSLCVEEGGFVGLIGPNGCGKTTLLKNIYKTYKPTRNAVFISGRDVMTLPPKEMAREVSVVAQENTVEFDVEAVSYTHLISFHSSEPLMSRKKASRWRISDLF